MTTLPDIPAFSSFLNYELTYTPDLVPTLSIEYHTEEYYSALLGQIRTSPDFDKITKSYQQFLHIQEEIVERHARDAHQERARIARDARTPRQRSKPSPTLLESIHEARGAYSKLRAMQDYGVQRHTRSVPIYTIQHPKYSMNPRSSEYDVYPTETTTVYDVEKIVFYYEIFADRHETLEENYMAVFGYNTLQEALRETTYLSTLLKHYSIHDIFLWYQQTFPYCNAFYHLYHKFSRRSEYFVSVQDSAEKHDEMLQTIREKTYHLQRTAAERVFTHLIHFDALGECPLSWLSASMNILEMTEDIKTYFEQEVDRIV